MKISEFQQLIRDLYLNRDKDRGLNATFIWLVEEIGELARILRNKDKNLNEVSEELADIIAWTNSIANILEINLEDSLIKKYPGLCIKCKSNPCDCKK